MSFLTLMINLSVFWQYDSDGEHSQRSREQKDNDCHTEKHILQQPVLFSMFLYVYILQIPRLQSISCDLLSCLLVGAIFPFTWEHAVLHDWDGVKREKLFYTTIIGLNVSQSNDDLLNILIQLSQCSHTWLHATTLCKISVTSKHLGNVPVKLFYCMFPLCIYFLKSTIVWTCFFTVVII